MKSRHAITSAYDRPALEAMAGGDYTEGMEELDSLKRALAPHFKQGFLGRDRTAFQFRFDDGSAPFHLIVTPEDFELVQGDAQAPTLTLLLDSHKTCFALLTGREDGMRAFMEGRYRADGHIVLSQLLLYLFKPDDDTIVYEVQD